MRQWIARHDHVLITTMYVVSAVAMQWMENWLGALYACIAWLNLYNIWAKERINRAMRERIDAQERLITAQREVIDRQKTRLYLNKLVEMTHAQD